MNKLVTGFALGLIVGILYAPDKGTATRRRIADKGNDLKDQFADFIDSVASRFEDRADDFEEYVHEETENLKAESI
ncbi:YtxH domain-containing protein [Niabella pedocola]|uniref:YtxH domain-containing protein n=1 Tax=Niabella pedocola TaxID=1752077 RepID=A0ABS8PSS4_9BACT|nr:YtxH domain-containing protein [Niabella pedocola]MBO9591661.1 YtxH domain-containing protein [Niabella sp.]MCD2423925.1 YtxH domain-containing protein [Niabella pedocola]